MFSNFFLVDPAIFFVVLNYVSTRCGNNFVLLWNRIDTLLMNNSVVNYRNPLRVYNLLVNKASVFYDLRAWVFLVSIFEFHESNMIVYVSTKCPPIFAFIDSIKVKWVYQINVFLARQILGFKFHKFFLLFQSIESPVSKNLFIFCHFKFILARIKFRLCCVL